MFRPRLAAVLPAVMAAGLSACSDTTQPTDSPAPGTDPHLRASTSQEPAGPLALGRGVRGFGGFFLDAQGTPTVYLKDPAERAAAARALEPWLRANGHSADRLQVRRGQYDWAELARWFPQASAAAFAFGGTVFVDADEAANRIRVGVERGTPEGQVKEALVRKGIPEAAIVIALAEPVRQLATLRNRVRPTVGGLQINFPRFLCTLGFNVTAGGERSFITASHCTNDQGGTEETPYWQPLESVDPVQIATEVDDPAYFRDGCYAGRRCRYSDASRAAYAEATTSTQGAIARTSGPNNNSLEIAGRFRINGEDLSTEFVIGSTLNKVGRTTGWTQGLVTNTCVDTGVLGSNIVQLCQTFVEAGVAGGDSGSPVFALRGGDNVTLAGILWGGGGSLFAFSPLANVERELGPLTTR